MLTLGIDPDSTDLAWAIWGPDGPVDAGVFHAVRRKGQQTQVEMSRVLRDSVFWPQADFAHIAIEGQQKDGRRAAASSLFTLAHVTGAALQCCTERYPDASIRVVTPKEWKGSVAKHAQQARMYRALDWGYTLKGTGTSRYAVPTTPPSHMAHIRATQWKHVGDALLLAQWAQHND